MTIQFSSSSVYGINKTKKRAILANRKGEESVDDIFSAIKVTVGFVCQEQTEPRLLGPSLTAFDPINEMSVISGESLQATSPERETYLTFESERITFYSIDQ